MADGVYIGLVMNGTPNEYIAFSPTGISITTPNNITISAQNFTLNATGDLTVTGGVTAGQGGADQVTLQHHTHSGGAAPTPGT